MQLNIWNMQVCEVPASLSTYPYTLLFSPTLVTARGTHLRLDKTFFLQLLHHNTKVG